MKKSTKLIERNERVEQINELVKLIGGLGRRFFWSEKTGAYAQMICDTRGRLYWQDQYTLELIYLHYRYWSKGFTNGGTMRHCVNMFKRYVMTGKSLPPIFGPWPDSICDGDLWGYGKENMIIIRRRARELGLLDYNGE
jgi:hypothetical protein